MLGGGGLSRQLSVDSLDSARDIAERQGELSDDSIEEMETDEEHNTANVDRRVGKSSRTRSRGVGGNSKHEKGVQARGSRRRRKEKHSLYGGGGGGRSGGTGTSPLSALYRYTYTTKSMPKEMTPYDAEFPSNRDELIQSAIETLMN